ncbi:hypothetical protein ACFSTH_07105 [Paenibacillus yanchengensis]|uniref:Uncharacterized protein n=1 Tax=Paenibacillus yanchengensis TaxID=2035833 RepID=A0ABW4YI47_9BACL
MKFRKFSKYGLLFIVLLSFSILFITQYSEKVKYEKYVSNMMNNDLHKLIGMIDEMNNSYNLIFSTNQLTKEQSRILMSQNEEISNIIREYRDLAVAINKRNDSFN